MLELFLHLSPLTKQISPPPPLKVLAVKLDLCLQSCPCMVQCRVCGVRTRPGRAPCPHEQHLHPEAVEGRKALLLLVEWAWRTGESCGLSTGTAPVSAGLCLRPPNQRKPGRACLQQAPVCSVRGPAEPGPSILSQDGACCARYPTATPPPCPLHHWRPRVHLLHSLLCQGFHILRLTNLYKANFLIL